MCTDIAHTTTFAGLFGVGTPGCLCIAFALSEPAEPALRIFYPNLADLTQCAILHQLPGLFDHRIPCIGMSQQQCQTGFFHFRSEEHTSELQSLMRISYAVFCLKKKKTTIE